MADEAGGEEAGGEEGVDDEGAVEETDDGEMEDVELSAEESAFYEALRQRAVEKLADVGDGRSQHLQILAEIMRLRRACCHPQLVVSDCGIAGSKLAMFSKTLNELLDNDHNVLVFSQFVDHLSI